MTRKKSFARAKWTIPVLIVLPLIVNLISRRSVKPYETEKGIVVIEEITNRGTISEDDPYAPQLCWLMSFPNSGTTYTARLVQEVSGTATANNYGTVVIKGNNQFARDKYTSRPVFHESENGPYIWPIFPMPLPTGYMLTKTHCEGFCYDCSPMVYVKSLHKFLMGCVAGSRTTSVQPPITEFVRYNAGLIRRAVILVRSPYDNIVSRFHHDKSMNVQNEEFKMQFTPDGFREWCQVSDQKLLVHEKLWWMKDEETEAVSQGVPCRSEFYKFVQWHNHAVAITTDIMHIPVHFVHYDDYFTKFDETLDEMLEFLDLQRSNPPLPFTLHEYPEFFTDEDTIAIKNFITFFASPETMITLGRYFTEKLMRLDRF